MATLKQRLIDFLVDKGHLRSGAHRPRIKPGHGPCCTCQECGRPHDECVCEDNQLLSDLDEFFEREADA